MTTILDHVRITVAFGHAASPEAMARITGLLSSHFAKLLGMEIPEEKLANLPAPVCEHHQMEASRTVDGHCVTEDSTGHRESAHALVDSIFDELERMKEQPGFLEQFLLANEEEEALNHADTDALLDLLAGVDLD